ncbi:MAG: LuxR family transcriptional regulator, partial [Cyanobacteria bacterium Co-bin13]|nr:LuxR family transcriptional regulator [Cyanobacteria bacterium Co-bin13]
MSFAENTSPFQGFSEGLADALEQVSGSIVAVQGRRRFACSGLCWQPGVIVTADYVLKRESALTVTLPNGETVSAEL